METNQKPSARISQGIITISNLVNYWIEKSSLTHREFISISSWGLGEESFLSKSDLSRGLNHKLSRGFSMKSLLALEAANAALFRWHTAGEENAVKELGSYRDYGVKESILDSAIWLPHPSSEENLKTVECPLSFSGLCEIQIGILEVPYITGECVI